MITTTNYAYGIVLSCQQPEHYAHRRGEDSVVKSDTRSFVEALVTL